jgi:orotidine-5'-phosphate decarboxylase
MPQQHFADRLTAAIESKNSRVVVGLDPLFDKLPAELRAQADSRGDAWPGNELWAIEQFCSQLITATAPFACAFKPQIAFFERYGGQGLLLLERLLAAHRAELFIMDCKRGDIGSTSEAYCAAYFGTDRPAPLECDAVTHSPYLGRDTIEPYLPHLQSGKGMFMLVKTSNPSSADFQDLLMGDIPLAEIVASRVDKWGEECIGASGFSSLGMVVGATFPEAAEVIRRIAPRAYMLVPGLETQGGQISDARCFATREGTGAIYNFSRAIMYAPDPAAAAEQYRDALNNALR